MADQQRRGRRAKRVVLVVSCTDRKRFPPAKELQLSGVPGESLEERAEEWCRRLSTVDAPRHTAGNLYAGAHWRAALDAWATTLRLGFAAELWVASAGYGLIRADERIKSYSATFASGQGDSVWRGPTDGGRRESLRLWWKRARAERSLAEVAANKEHVLFALGATYVEALEEDLAAVLSLPGAGDRVGVISSGSDRAPGSLRASSALRGAVGGTYGSLNAKLLAFVASHAEQHEFDIARIRTFLAGLEPPAPAHPPARRALSDTEVKAFIREARDDSPGLSRTQALRSLRGAGLACEQSRFARLWAETPPLKRSPPRRQVWQGDGAPDGT